MTDNNMDISMVSTPGGTGNEPASDLGQALSASKYTPPVMKKRLSFQEEILLSKLKQSFQIIKILITVGI